MRETKNDLVEQIKKELKTWNEAKSKYYKCTKKDMKNFLASIKAGHYDKMLNNTYYYSLNSLISWHKLRLERQSRWQPMSPITTENYEVFKEIKRVLGHINDLINSNTVGTYHQTLPTKEELQEIIAIYQNVIITDYSYNETEQVKKRIKKMNIYDNKKFPHNTEELSAIFFPQIVKLSSRYEGKCVAKNIQTIKDPVQEIKNSILEGNIREIFINDCRSKEECYIRRMILSQIDIPAAIYENYYFFFTLAIDMVRSALEEGLVLDDELQDLLWKDIYISKTTIFPLVTAVLTSLEQEQKSINIMEELKKSQKDNNFSGDIVTRKYQNKIHVDGMITIYSMNPENIPYFLQSLQSKYNRLYEEGTDYEFIEGCIEIMGDLMISQIFLDGNKRTSKCLFNKMLLSRGILPPVVDLIEDELSLWDSFVKSRNLNYIKAIEKILEQTKEMALQFKEGYYDNKVIVSEAAASRPDFCNKYYRR